jgi:hypothetical protein
LRGVQRLLAQRATAKGLGAIVVQQVVRLRQQLLPVRVFHFLGAAPVGPHARQQRVLVRQKVLQRFPRARSVCGDPAQGMHGLALVVRAQPAAQLAQAVGNLFARLHGIQPRAQQPLVQGIEQVVFRANDVGQALAELLIDARHLFLTLRRFAGKRLALAAPGAVDAVQLAQAHNFGDFFIALARSRVHEVEDLRAAQHEGVVVSHLEGGAQGRRWTDAAARKGHGEGFDRRAVAAAKGHLHARGPAQQVRDALPLIHVGAPAQLLQRARKVVLQRIHD